MTSRDFCYWLQGFFEIAELGRKSIPDPKYSGSSFTPAIEINPEQLQEIRRHLRMVFVHEIDPSFGKDQNDLHKIHDSSKGMGPRAAMC